MKLTCQIIKNRFAKRWTNILEASGWYATTYATGTTGDKALDIQAEYPTSQCKLEPRSDNEFNPVFAKKNSRTNTSLWAV